MQYKGTLWTPINSPKGKKQRTKKNKNRGAYHFYLFNVLSAHSRRNCISVSMQGFTVDGRRDGEFVNRCVEVNRTEESGSDTIQGVVIKDMNIKYCG